MASELYLGGNAADGTPIAAIKTVPISTTTGLPVSPATQDAGANRVVLYNAAGTALLLTGGNVLAMTPVRNDGSQPTGPGDVSNSATVLPLGGTINHNYDPATGQFVQQRNPSVVKNVAAVAITAATPVTVWTPAGGKKWRLMGFALSTTVAGSIIFKDNTTEVFRTPLLVANTPFACPPGMANFLLSTAANNPLKLDLTVTGNVSGFIFGTEE